MQFLSQLWHPYFFTFVKHYVISYKGGDEDVIVLSQIEHVGGHM